MDRDKLDRLLDDHARRQPEDRVLSDEERVQLQAELAKEPDEQEPDEDELERHRRTTRVPWLLGSGVLAAAAIIAIVLLPPSQTLLNLGITVVTSESAGDLTRSEARFEVDVSVNDAVHAHLVVLDESGGFSVLPEAAKLIDKTGTVGSFRIWPEGEAIRRTHAVIMASKEPISAEALSDALPDQLPAGAEADRDAQLRRLCADLAKRFGWVAKFKPIPVPGE